MWKMKAYANDGYTWEYEYLNNILDLGDSFVSL